MKWLRAGLIACLVLAILMAPIPAAFAAEGTQGEESEIARAIARKNQEFDPADAEILGDVPVAEPKNYTLMVYVIGSNLESKLGSASSDLWEMEDSGLDYENANLILYTGGSSRWLSDVPCDKNCVLDFSKDPEERVVAGTRKNADMGAYETLAAFVNFSVEHYPAEHYGLIFWDHGGGPLWGYGADELFQGDGLLLSEMKLAMGRTDFSKSKKLDFVGFDACLMGNLETMAVWAEYADYYVASEELEPGDGWDYHFLKVLNKSEDPEKITSAIVQSFESYYKENKTEYCNPDVTLSVTKLSEIDAVQTALGNAALAMSKSLEFGQGREITAARLNAKSFGITGRAEDGTQFYYDLVDLGSFAKGLQEVSEKEGKDLQAALKAFVIKNYSNVDGASGVTLYYPANNRSQYNEMREIYEKLGLNREYGDFIKSVGKSWMGGSRQDWQLEAPALDEKGENYVLTLTKEQNEKVSSVTYSILVRDETGEYWTILDRIRAWPDDNGQISLPRNPRLVTLKTLEDQLPWPAALVEDGPGRNVYQTVQTRLLSSGISNFERPSIYYEDVTVTLQANAKNDVLTVKSIGAVSEEAQGAGKETVDVSHFDSILYYYAPKIPTWSAEGYLMPFSEWRQDSKNRSGMQTLESSFSFAMAPASKLSEELYYVVTVEDEGGWQYVTEPVKIEPVRNYVRAKEATAQGEMIFQVYGDKAVLVSYAGTDEELTIPDKVEGAYVTEIAPYAFSKLSAAQGQQTLPVRKIHFPMKLKKIGSCAFQNCVSLETLELPQTMESIGSRAFYHCIGFREIKLPSRIKSIGAYAFAECVSLKSVTLPPGVNVIGKGVFACCESLGEIALSKSNSRYQVVDGALYQKSGDVLLAVPARMTGSFEVKKGTKVIASDCFSSSRLSEVILPEGLLRIDNYAFYAAKQLRVPSFPESLTGIGNYAFYAGWNGLNLDEVPKGVQEIRLGPDVSYLGKEAFVGFVERRFAVDENNPSYQSVDGALLNKAGDAILEFAANGQNTFLIPEGVKTFDVSILEQIGQDGNYYANPPYHLYVPDSVFRFTGRTMFLWDVVLHCSQGSKAENFAAEEEINVSYEWDPIEREVSQETPKGELTYQISKKKAILVHYRGTDEELVIPAQVEGRPVTQIGNGIKGLMGALDAKTVKRVVLPEQVEVIAAHAFEYFGTFSCELPRGLKILGDEAFSYCYVPFTELPEGLVELGAQALGNGCDFSGGVTIPAGIQWIAPGAFLGMNVSEFRMGGTNEEYCVKNGMLYSADGTILVSGRMPDADGSIEIPEGTRIIGTYAFMGLPVREVKFSKTLTMIAQYGFAYCNRLETLELPDGFQNVGSYAFVYTGLRRLTLPESCERVGIAAFFGSSLLEGVSGNPKTVEGYAFAYCESLSNISLGNHTLEIGDCAFYQTAVTSIQLPENLYSLGSHVFAADDPKLKSKVMNKIVIGKNLAYLGENAFGTMPVAEFAVDEENPFFTVTEHFLTDKAGKRLIACPSGMAGTVRIPDCIHEIASYAFYSCEFVPDVIVPESVRVIGQNAFCDHSAAAGEGNGYRPVLHCKEGSAAQSYAMEWSFPYAIDGVAK